MLQIVDHIRTFWEFTELFWYRRSAVLW